MLSFTYGAFKNALYFSYEEIQKAIDYQCDIDNL